MLVYCSTKCWGTRASADRTIKARIKYLHYPSTNSSHGDPAQKKVSTGPSGRFRLTWESNRVPVHTRGVRVTGRGMAVVSNSGHRTHTRATCLGNTAV